MGCPSKGPDNLRPLREISLDAFCIAKTPTTYEQWSKVYLWALKNGYRFLNPSAVQMGAHVEAENQTATSETEVIEHQPQEPACGVSWIDAVLWCNAASEMEGRSPCYFAQAEHTEVLREPSLIPSIEHVNWKNNGYRLPTEAEWEYACRANLGSRTFFWGEDADDDYFWINRNSSNRTHIVASKKPNAFGLYDMLGNVWQWCFDWLADYNPLDLDNPKGGTGPEKVVRGGSFNFNAWHARSAYRTTEPPESTKSHLGFRVVCSKQA